LAKGTPLYGQFWLNQTTFFMKKYYILLSVAILAATIQTQAQTKIGGTGAPDGSAMLEVTGGAGNNKGILPPRLTTAQRDAINLPAKALMIYNTTTDQLQINTGTPAAPVWSVTTQANAWSTNGNAGTTPATNFIGTTDAQPLVLRTNATEQMRVTSTGNVGIGTATPSNKLHVVGNNQVNMSVENTNGNINGDYAGVNTKINSATGTPIGTTMFSQSLASQPNGGVGGIRTSTAHDLALGTNNAEHMRITTAGNVGIGTLVPTAKLDVNGTARIQGSAGTPTAITGRNATGDIGNVSVGTGLNLTGGVLSATPATPGWALAGNTGSNPNINYIGTADGQPLIIRTDATERMRVQSTGNIGIATNFPQQTLHVEGTARVTGSAGTPTTITGRNATGDIGNLTLGTGLTLTGGVLSASPAASGWALTGNTGTNPASNYIGTSDAQPLVLRTNAAERMRVLANGNVGINNVAPISPLSFANALGTKIAFFDGGLNQYMGIGVSSAQLNYHVASNSTHVFYAGGTNGDGTELMRIANTGNVGIGTSAPTAKLDVNGTARIQGSTGTPTAITGRDAAGNINNITLGANLSLAGGVLSATGGGTSGWGLNGNAGTDVNINYIGTSDGQPLAFRTGAGELMRLENTGNLGINTNNPQRTLHVQGGVRITGNVGTPTAIMGRDGAGDINNLTLGTGLTLTGGVLSASPATSGWALSGNAGSDPNINYVGTADGQPLIFRTNATERMRMQSTGNIGIGTNNPAVMLDVDSGDVALTQTHKLIWGADSDERIFAYRDIGYPGANLFLESRENIGFIIDRNNTASVSNTVGFIWATNTSWLDGIPQELMRLTDAGNLGLGIAAPAYRMDVVGDINASATVRAGGVVLTSDARLKRNISNTQKGLSTIMKLNPVEYEKKNTIQDSVYDRHEIGFIAQEVAKVLPSLVTEGKDADKTLAVSYTELIPVLTKAMQEQQGQIDALKAENQKLKTAEVELKENKVATAQLMERVKQMEQMMGIKEIEGSSKVAGK
jgi:hypothetical protein